jgi:transcriptional regulator with XRE-family HTH domain
MPRPALSDEQRRLGRSLGEEIQRRREPAPATTLASLSGVNLDTLRKVEQGLIGAPGLFLVADIANALQVTLDDLVEASRRGADRGGQS